jgi:hypothetical protein
MSDLRARAALAKTSTDEGGPYVPATPGYDTDGHGHEVATAPDLTESGVPAAMDVTVYVAWSRVMADVQWIGKGTSKGLRYEFRGIDAVLNAVGPALRKHGVTVVQTGVETTYETMKTTGGSSMRLCVARVSYAVFGPTGDRIAAPAPPTADEYAAEIERERTSIDRLRAIRRELAAHPGIGETVVSTLGGEDLTLNELLSRVGRQRTAAQSS